ncbi:MAG: hypothetical protein DMF63_12765 [Acidobacteria bacterium]|nr:MAG: hypothetical protein DMF63_12765 [Acidobacteriota bacterium]
MFSFSRKSFFVIVVLGLLTTSALAQKNSSTDFQNFLTKLDAAQLEMQNGKSDAFKALWSDSEEITLSGGFGGTVEKGPKAIDARLDWVGQQFSNGTNKIERVVATASGDFAYVVQLEHIRFHVPGKLEESTRDYRVTMVFRREKTGWRILHRQADTNLTKQAPQ